MSNYTVLILQYYYQYKQTIVSLIRLDFNSHGENVYTDSWCSSVYIYIVCVDPKGL